MSFTRVDGTLLHHRYRAGRGPAVVLLNSLGTDLRIWEAVVDALPADVPVLRMDKRGHGLSGAAPASIERLAEDAAALMRAQRLDGALVLNGVAATGDAVLASNGRAHAIDAVLLPPAPEAEDF